MAVVTGSLNVVYHHDPLEMFLLVPIAMFLVKLVAIHVANIYLAHVDYAHDMVSTNQFTLNIHEHDVVLRFMNGSIFREKIISRIPALPCNRRLRDSRQPKCRSPRRRQKRMAFPLQGFLCNDVK